MINPLLLKCQVARRVVIFSDEPDIAIYRDDKIQAAIEIKGGIDTAGVLERVGAAIKSLRRAREENPQSTTILLQGVSVTPKKNDLEINRDAVNHWFTIEDVLENQDRRNVGAAVRAASCFGIKQVWFTGDRVAIALEARKRLPREERMKGYAAVQLINFDYPSDAFPKHAVPVAIELCKHSERLPEFVHPERCSVRFWPRGWLAG